MCDMLPWISTFEWWMYLFVCLVPECVARVPVSLLGSGGWGCVRQTTVRNPSQPFAWCPYGRAYGEFCKRGQFWRFQKSRSLVSRGRRGRRGTSWQSRDSPTCFTTCWMLKVVLCGRRSTLETSIVISRGRRNTLDVSRCFFPNRIVRAAWSGDNVQIPWQARHFLMWSRKY